jgi:hypothetical protein
MPLHDPWDAWPEFTPSDVEHLLVPTPDDVRYRFRARTIGMEEWVCVYCGTLNRTRLRPQSFVVRCINAECRRHTGLGRIAYLLPAGVRLAPPDTVIPLGLREAFPYGDLGRWSSGQPVHRVRMIERTDLVTVSEDI